MYLTGAVFGALYNSSVDSSDLSGVMQSVCCSRTVRKRVVKHASSVAALVIGYRRQDLPMLGDCSAVPHRFRRWCRVCCMRREPQFAVWRFARSCMLALTAARPAVWMVAI
jgi:hypothetical protein